MLQYCIVISALRTRENQTWKELYSQVWYLFDFQYSSESMKESTHGTCLGKPEN